MSSLISFISALLFSVYDSFVSLGRFIPRYFILFVGMVNGIDSLISLSDFLLLVYRNASDSCVLILYTAALLYSLNSSSNFLVVSLGFSIYNIMLCANSKSFTSFPTWIHFVYFSSITDVVSTSKFMLNYSGESGRSCLVPELGGNAFSFSPLRIIFAVDLSYGLYYFEVDFFYAHFWRVLS